jgi:hypothetical protein
MTHKSMACVHVWLQGTINCVALANEQCVQRDASSGPESPPFLRGKLHVLHGRQPPVQPGVVLEQHARQSTHPAL